MDDFKDKLSNAVAFIRHYWQIVLVGFLAAVVGLAYLAGIITQAQASGGAYMLGGEGPTVNKSFFYCLRLGLITGAGLRTLGLLLVLIIVAFVVIVGMRNMEGSGEMDPDRNFDYSKKSTYGTAGWMTKKEMAAALDNKPVEKTYGTILGAIGKNVISIVPTVRKDSVVHFTDADKQKSMRTNKHVCVLGASGSMKSRTYVRNTIFQCARRGESMVITDPKGEMYEDVAEMLRNEGYIVKVFNLKDQIYSDSWDCLGEVTDEVMAQVFCSTIIQNTGGQKGDHFWDNSEMNLLKALVLYVCIEHKEKGLPVTMAEVYRLLTVSKAADLEIMFNRLPQTHSAYVPYSIYAQAGENVRGNIIIGLASRIQVFQSQVTKNITSFPEIDLTLPGKKKCVYFCAISDQDATFTFLSSLFFSFLFIKLVKFADNYGKNPGKLDVPVNFILDEFSNIGLIPDFEKKISTVRSRDINISVIIQNIPQLKSRYPNDVYQEIIGNCDTQLFLGCTDETTAEYISNRSGVATIDIQSEQTVRKTIAVAQFVPEYKKTDSVGKRNVLTPDEVLRLPGKQALVIIRGEKILKVDKYDFTRHPWSKKMVPCRMADRIPRWHRREMEADAAGLELRTEKKGNGNLYYFDPDTGVFYERTTFINAEPGEPIATSVPKGDTIIVPQEKSTGFQIVVQDGVAMVIRTQTGEVTPFYGFDSRGNLLEHEQTDLSETDDMIEVADVEVGEDVVEYDDEDAVAHHDAFENLIDGGHRRRGNAQLEAEFLDADELVAPGSSHAPEVQTFVSSTQGMGSGTAVKEIVFEDVEEDTAPDDGNWIHGEDWSRPDAPAEQAPAQEDDYDEQPAPRQNTTPAKKPAPMKKETAPASKPISPSEDNDTEFPAKKEPQPEQQPKSSNQRQPKQRVTQNADLFSLNSPSSTSKKKKSGNNGSSDGGNKSGNTGNNGSGNKSVGGGAVSVPKTATPPSAKKPAQKPSQKNSQKPDPYGSAQTSLFDLTAGTDEPKVQQAAAKPAAPVQDGKVSEEVAEAVRAQLAAEQEAAQEAAAEIVQASVADVTGDLQMASGSKKGKKKKTPGERDHDEDDRTVDTSRDDMDRGSDWDYAFVDSNDLFD